MTASTQPDSDREVVGDRFRTQRVLKTGNGSSTVLAEDLRDGTEVVVKSVDTASVDDATRRRFEHETRILSTLVGLGLPGLRESGEHNGRLFLVQPYLGDTTLERLLANGPLTVETALRIGVAVASALDIAHSAGICHRDVKPANIVAGAGEAVHLVDFGFARSGHLDASLHDEMVGTIRYLAPESAGLLAVAADERSDLYALGVVLFECLTGSVPFTGPTVRDLLRQHLSAPVPPLHAAGRPVPRAVEAAVHRLLRKDPGERYQSAAAVAADLAALADLLASGATDPSYVIGRLDRRRGLTDPSFVGRGAELAELTAFIDDVAAGAGGAVRLEADSGGGKSRLLEEVLRHADQAGLRVLRAQGVALAGQRPFAMLHSLAGELADTLTADEQRDLREAVGAVAPSVVRALPAMAGALQASADDDIGPEEFGELRSIVALARMLGAVARRDRPLLLVFDDCQWADTLTVRLLNELFAPGSPAHLGLIVAFRSDEVPRTHGLRRIPSARRVRLGPLPPDAMTMLVESMAGPVPADALDIVLRLGDGNPFMGAAVVRGMVETGALVPEADGWTVDADRLEDVQAARRSAAFLVRRLELLSDDALQLLSVGAVLGKQFDLDVAVEVAGRPSGALDIIEGARRNRLLWIDEVNGRWRFFHDKIREALIDRLDAEARSDLHSRAADALAARAADDVDGFVFDLAYHLDAAGRHADALPHALSGAALARDRYALDTAVSHYRMAERAVPADDLATRLIIAEGLGDVLTLQGVYAQAQTQLLLARSMVDDVAHAAALETKLGALAFKTGDIVGAKAHLEGALARLGRRVPQHNVVFLVRVVWEALVQVVHTVLPRLAVGRRKDAAETELLAMRIYSRLAYLYWFHSGRIACAWTHLRGLNLAERYGPSAELGQAYSEHGPVMTTLPLYARGKKYVASSLMIRRDLGDVWGQGQSLGFTAVVDYAAGNWARAREAAEAAIALLERTGDQWEVNTARWHLALCHWRAGRLTEAAETARELFRSASAIGDLTSAGISFSIWTRAQHGSVDLRLVADLLGRGSEDAQTTAELHLAAALVHRHSGDLRAAERSMLEGLRVVREAKLRQEYIAVLFPWHATVLRERAEALPGLDPHRRKTALRAAATSARRARRWARWYRNNAPHALRESGLIAAMRGRDRQASRWLERSRVVAEAQGAAYELAQTRLAIASRDTARGMVADTAAARAAVDGFLARPADLDRDATLSLSDRFAALLTVGRAIGAATSHSALEAAIRDAARALLRIEECHLVPVTAGMDTDLASLSGGRISGLSRALVSQAVAELVPVVSSDLPEDTNESLIIAGVRSALAAPITVAGEPRSCLYVTHRDVGQLFGDEEIQLAAFVTTLAGAAYEHLAGNETRFRSLVQKSSDVITLIDADGLVSYQSSAIASEFGFSPAGFVGQSIVGWVHPDDHAEFMDALAASRTSPETRVECRLRNVSGEYRTCDTSLTDLLDEPNVAAIVLTTRDVTERTRFEAELVEKNLALEKAGKAKDMFLASMSHELRTPLNSIMGFTGALLMGIPGRLNPEQERQLTIVEQNGTHLLSIINDLLDLARIESGQVQLTLHEIDCGQVVIDVLRTLEPLAAEKGLRLTRAVPDELVPIRSDERALSQILINLVNNAIKFTDDGGVHVSVVAEPDGVRISVADTGVGIDALDLDRIFAAFARAKDSSRRAREGTGLGLHISQKLAELIEASIEVQAAPGEGTTFTVRLPAAMDGGMFAA
jgi:PAS domain S-box-containing protein